MVLRPNDWLIAAGSTIFLVAGVASFALAPPAAGFLVFIAVVGFAWSLFELRRSIFRHPRTSITQDRRVSKLVVETQPDDRSERHGAAVVALHHLGDALMRSAEIDRWLRSSGPIPVVTSQVERARRRDLLRQDPARYGRLLHAGFVDSKRNRRMFHNETKVGLSSDLPADRVVIWQGSYFTSFLTNELTRLRFEPDGAAEPVPISDPAEAFDLHVVDGRRLRPLGASVLANHAGANTMAITAEGRLVLWRQSFHAQFSRDLLAPTGSGSLDWDDTIDRRDLQSIVIAGMERELLEESTPAGAGWQRSWISSTALTGYFRWIGRGGLPGFTGLTRLSVSVHDLAPNTAEVDRPPRLTTDWDASSAEALATTVATLLDERLDELSLPLVACLLGVRDALATDRERLERLLE